MKWSRTLPNFTKFFRSSCRKTSRLQVSMRLLTTLATCLPEKEYNKRTLRGGSGKRDKQHKNARTNKTKTP